MKKELIKQGLIIILVGFIVFKVGERLNVVSMPTFFVKAPGSGKVEFEMKYNNYKIKNNKVTIGGEFVKIGYIGNGGVFNIPINFN